MSSSNEKDKTLSIVMVVIILVFIAFAYFNFIGSPLEMMSFAFGPLTGLVGLLILPFRIFGEVARPILSQFGFFSFHLNRFSPFILLILWIIVLSWVYKDAEKRGMNGVLWTLLVFVGNVVGLIIYLIVRNETVTYRRAAEPDLSCPQCENPINKNFTFCPACGTKIHNVCSNCGQNVENEWKICPHCGKETDQ